MPVPSGPYIDKYQDSRKLADAPHFVEPGSYQRVQGNIFQRAKSSISQSIKSTNKSENIALKKISHFFKGTDGFDELASALGQVLPSVDQHIFTLSLLAPITPLVAFGAMGMATDYEESRQTAYASKMAHQALFKTIFTTFGLSVDLDLFEKDEGNVQQIIQKLEQIKNEDPVEFEKKSNFINEFAKTCIHETAERNAVKIIAALKDFNGEQSEAFDEKVRLLVEYLDSLSHDAAVKIGYDAAPLGVFAMTGMFFGMLSAMATSSFEIAAREHQAISWLEEVAKYGEILTDSVFVGSQLFMAFYSFMKAHQGQLEKEAKAFEKTILEANKQASKTTLAKTDTPSEDQMSEAFYQAIHENIDRHIEYIHLEKVRYGRWLGVSEMAMSIGTLLDFTPLAPFSIPILVPAALSTMALSGLRIYAIDKKGKFTGHAHNHEHNGKVFRAMRDGGSHVKRRLANIFRKSEHQVSIPEPRLSDSNVEGHTHYYASRGFSQMNFDMKSNEQTFKNTTDELVYLKYISLLLETLGSNHSIEKMVRTGKKSFFRRTTLQSDILKGIQKEHACKKRNYHKCLGQRIKIPEVNAKKLGINAKSFGTTNLEAVLNNESKADANKTLGALILNMTLSDIPSLLEILFNESGDQSPALAAYNSIFKDVTVNDEKGTMPATLKKDRVTNEKYATQFEKHLQNKRILSALKPYIYRALLKKFVSTRKINRILKRRMHRNVPKDLFSPKNMHIVESLMRNQEILTIISQGIVREQKALAKRTRQKVIDQQIYLEGVKYFSREAKKGREATEAKTEEEEKTEISPFGDSEISPQPGKFIPFGSFDPTRFIVSGKDSKPSEENLVKGKTLSQRKQPSIKPQLGNSNSSKIVTLTQYETCSEIDVDDWQEEDPDDMSLDFPANKEAKDLLLRKVLDDDIPTEVDLVPIRIIDELIPDVRQYSIAEEVNYDIELAKEKLSPNFEGEILVDEIPAELLKDIDISASDDAAEAMV